MLWHAMNEADQTDDERTMFAELRHGFQVVIDVQLVPVKDEEPELGSLYRAVARVEPLPDAAEQFEPYELVGVRAHEYGLAYAGAAAGLTPLISRLSNSERFHKPRPSDAGSED